MATIKSYTNLEQSKKLAEILPLESADMHYREWKRMTKNIRIAHVGSAGEKDLPCWSLAALLGVIPYNITFNKAVYRFKLVKFSNHWECYHENFGTVSTNIFKADNPIDACYEMIIKLHELNLL